MVLKLEEFYFILLFLLLIEMLWHPNNFTTVAAQITRVLRSGVRNAYGLDTLHVL